MKKTPLTEQVEKIYRHARQGSIATRREYRKCMLRYCDWLTAHYNMQNLRNISNKHLAAYVHQMLDNNKSPGYIIKMLSSIRYYHDQLPNPRYKLTQNNQELGVPKRVAPGNRAWNPEEVELLCAIAIESGQEWLVDVITLQIEMGLRIHEVIRLYRVDAERALADNYLKIKGKGGKVRATKQLTPLAEQALRGAMIRVKRGSRLFVVDDQKAHEVIKQVQDFIRNNRPAREGEPLTSHGLRYSYAQKRLGELKNEEKISQPQAEKKISQEMGHNRARVTRGYTFFKE